MNSHGAPGASVWIDLDAIARNAEILEREQSSVGLTFDLSADAYGHGAEAVLNALRRGRSPDEDLRIGRGSPAQRDNLYGLGIDSRYASAMRVVAPVLSMKTVEAGEGVSYGYTYRATERTNLAFVGIGYSNGLDRAAGNRASLLLDGKLRRVAGRVAMNSLMLELGRDVTAVGSTAVVFGDPLAGEPAAAQWAATLGIGASEVASVFGAHLPRYYR